MPAKPIGTLYYSHNLNPRVAVAVARHLRAPVEFVRIEPMGKDQEAFRPINPNTLVPVLVEPGRTLWETDAIAMRLASLLDESFWPSAQCEEVMHWVSWSAHHFTRAGDALYFEHIIVPRFFNRPADQQVVARALVDFHRFAAILDDWLARRTWLVGDGLTYADFRVASVLPFAVEAKLPLEPFAHIQAWHARLDRIEAWRQPFDGLD